jgi:hypothetical protein
MRTLIHDAAPGVIEERKWKKASNAMAGVPVWSLGGILCTGETYRDKVKLTFARGAALPDPAGLFNSSLEGGTRRAIDLHHGEKVAAGAFKALVRAAVALNAPAGKTSRATPARSGTRRSTATKPRAGSSSSTPSRAP